MLSNLQIKGLMDGLEDGLVPLLSILLESGAPFASMVLTKTPPSFSAGCSIGLEEELTGLSAMKNWKQIMEPTQYYSRMFNVLKRHKVFLIAHPALWATQVAALETMLY